jgi:hypothetical protein
VADRSRWTVAIVTLAFVASLFGSPRVATAESPSPDGVAPVAGWAVFDFGRTDRLRAKLAQAERRQAAAERRALAAEKAARRAHAASEAEHAARQREHAAYERAHVAFEQEHIAYERELASLAAYRTATKAERAAREREHAAYRRERIAYEREHKAYERERATVAAYRKKSDIQRDQLARLNAHKRTGPSPALHLAPKRIVEAPRSPAKPPRPADATRKSVGWGPI